MNGEFVEGEKLALEKLRTIREEFFLDLFDKFDTSLEYYGKGFNQNYRAKNLDNYKIEI